jgi:hypothetical protein
MKQLEDNLGYRDLILTDDDLTRLNELSDPLESYPYRFLKKYASRET